MTERIIGEAELLRVLADRLDRLEAITQFPEDIKDPGTVTVEWTEGRELPGYSSLGEAISLLVAEHWTALRSEVVRQHKTDIAAAREALSKLQERGQSGKVGRPSPTADDPLGKVVELDSSLLRR